MLDHERSRAIAYGVGLVGRRTGEGAVMRIKALTFAAVFVSTTMSYAATLHEVSISLVPASVDDPTRVAVCLPACSVDARIGDPVAVTVPVSTGGIQWTVTSVDGALSTPTKSFVARWLGPSNHGNKFKFTTAQVQPGDHAILFVSSSHEPETDKMKASVTIHLKP
jgi:hypothetical protein